MCKGKRLFNPKRSDLSAKLAKLFCKACSSHPNVELIFVYLISHIKYWWVACILNGHTARDFVQS